MKRQRPIARVIALTVGAAALIAGTAADARSIGGASPHVSMNGSRVTPRTHLDLPHNIPVRKNVRGHCVLKFIPRVLSASYSGRPHGRHGHGRHYHPNNGGKMVLEPKLVCA
jgi:hypothetical protein